MKRFNFGGYQPELRSVRYSARTPRSDWMFFVNSDKKRRRESRFVELWQCEIETFRTSNGYHEFDEALEYTAVDNDHEVTFCEWPKRLQTPQPVCDTENAS